MSVAHEVFAAEGAEVDVEEDGNETLEEFMIMGQDLLPNLHGERGTKGYADPANKTTGSLYTMAIGYGYGWLWH